MFYRIGSINGYIIFDINDYGVYEFSANLIQNPNNQIENLLQNKISIFIKNNKVDMIMSAHVYNKNLDAINPATLSYNINTKLLRNKLGFQGVLVSDDLQMYAISKHYNLKQTLTLAINSGVNMLLFANQLAKPITLKQIVDVVYAQVLSEQISLETIIKANKRIDSLLAK